MGRLKRAVCAAAGGIATTALGVLAAVDGLGAVAAAMLLFTAAGLMLYARHWARLAGRSRVGAHSEKRVRRALALLEDDGWRVRHSLVWRHRGDIDHVVIAPSGVAFAIETKTRTYGADHLALVCAQAAWLRLHRRRWCPRGAVPVLCIARAVSLEHVHDEVLVVSADRLVGALRGSAGAAPRPRFLAPIVPTYDRVD
jgi:hypothetical protein